MRELPILIFTGSFPTKKINVKKFTSETYIKLIRIIRDTLHDGITNSKTFLNLINFVKQSSETHVNKYFPIIIDREL